MLTTVADPALSPATDVADDGVPGSSSGVEEGLDELEARICDLAARMAMATCRWLELIVEFDAREGWRESGRRSAAHWLSWRCGLSLSAAYEQLRVGHALGYLPLVRAELAAGRLSYSKVRALTRIAGTPHQGPGGRAEEDLIVLAHSAPAAHLDRIARGVRRARSLDDPGGQALRRRLQWWYDDDGMLQGRFRLTADEGAVVVQALQAAMDTLDQPTDSSAEEPTSARPAEAADRHRDSSAEESRSPEGDCGPSSITERRHPGLAADALGLLAETFLAGTPAFLSGGDKYRVVIYADTHALADTDTEADDEADSPTTLRPVSDLGPGRRSRCELADGTPLASETAQRLACDTGVVGLLCDRNGHPLQISDLTRFPSAATERAVRARDRGTCQAPGCGNRLGLQIDHVIHWAHGGDTRLANLVTLCRFHHWLVHEGGFTVSATGQRPRFVFHRPDGAVIPATGHLRPPDDTHGDDTTATLRPVIGSPTLGDDPLSPPWWSGDPLDLHYTVSLLTEAQRARQRGQAA